MSKTPVMILQELGVKEYVVPKYTIISQSDNAPVKTFTCQVEYKNNCVSGIASSKKQAKQNAAQNMLQLLQKSKDVTTSPVRRLSNESNIDIEKPSCTPTSIHPVFTNYVGSLQECCVKYRLKNPLYELRQISGPSHNLEFIMTCTIGSITEEAIAHTKKQAKQDVAKKVLENLLKTLNITNNESCEQVKEQPKQINEQILQDLNVKISNLKIIDCAYLKDIEFKYKNAINQGSSSNHQMYSNTDIPINLYHLFYKRLIYNKICDSGSEKLILLLATLKTDLENNSSVDKCKNTLACLEEQCNFSIERVTLTSNNGKMYIIGFRVNNRVPFTQFHISNNKISAEIGALQKIIEALLVYLK